MPRVETRSWRCAWKTIWSGGCLTMRPFSPTWAAAPREIRYRFQKSPFPVAVIREFRPCCGLPADLLHRAGDGEQRTTDRSRSRGNPSGATIGGVPAPVSFAGPALGLIGLYQVNVQVPKGMTDFPLTCARPIAISPHNAHEDSSDARAKRPGPLYVPPTLRPS